VKYGRTLQNLGFEAINDVADVSEAELKDFLEGPLIAAGALPLDVLRIVKGVSRLTSSLTTSTALRAAHTGPATTWGQGTTDHATQRHLPQPYPLRRHHNTSAPDLLWWRESQLPCDALSSPAKTSQHVYDTCCRACGMSNDRGGKHDSRCASTRGNPYQSVSLERRVSNTSSSSVSTISNTRPTQTCREKASRSQDVEEGIRDIVHPWGTGDTHHSVGVYVLWRVKAGMPLRLLVHRRSFQLKHGAGLVSVPGGRVSAGYTFRDSAVRELAEEAGVDVKTSQLQHVVAHNHFGTCSQCDKKQRIAYRVIFESPNPPRVRGPDKVHAWEIDGTWEGTGAVGTSAGAATGHRWATAEELRGMHLAGMCRLFFPRGLGDIEMFRAFDLDLPLDQPRS
jgi:8-oxo-dGTP pyrophosphatase MutT (NUDIX family)